MRPTHKELAEILKRIFNIWEDGYEGYLLEKIWSKLFYSNVDGELTELEYVQVIFKIVAFRNIYGEFCEYAFDEFYENDTTIWLSEFELPTHRVGQLFGILYNDLNENVSELKEDESYIAMVEVLELHYRRILVKEIIKSMNLNDLFVTMYLTVPYYSEEKSIWGDGEEDEAEDMITSKISNFEGFLVLIENKSYEVLSELSTSKLEAFNWVINGFE